MDRREALKKIGLSFGILIGAPTAVSVLQGCGRGNTGFSNPHFFNQPEAEVITKIVDIILPPTKDTPGASDVGVPQFIDQYLEEVVPLDERARTKEYLNNFIEQIQRETGKQKVSEFTKSDIEPFVAKSLNKSQAEEDAIYEQIDNYVQAKQNGDDPELIEEVAAFALLTNLRSMAIWSYKTSQKIGEKVLAYDPVPGRQQGCVNLQDETGGKAWSL
ncbi:gluconate 2-dehydrogenase subunit 3 family protein [Fodinibius halophilus]|uniref:Gluconate 2-dehydrogenase subunit 3 family protein n=1 Tax=Fodinibius halophilus TaxID=1736908 RepID=A0A6M1T059_9BACT|nr:gluconate 2-dehydrogenase subunit 3 family protein [Fodinibius halophilus]NGP88876.1 gluconate 2-dehydrogenase subunit 3 family protein [Fodinibius halophilus]